jgi:hypothetical protein
MGSTRGERRTIEKSESHFFASFINGALESIVAFSEFDDGVHKFKIGHSLEDYRRLKKITED